MAVKRETIERPDLVQSTHHTQSEGLNTLLKVVRDIYRSI